MPIFTEILTTLLYVQLQAGCNGTKLLTRTLYGDPIYILSNVLNISGGFNWCNQGLQAGEILKKKPVCLDDLWQTHL